MSPGESESVERPAPLSAERSRRTYRRRHARVCSRRRNRDFVRSCLFACLLAAGSACDLTTDGIPLPPSRPSAAPGPLVVHPSNPAYFADPDGEVVYLTGAHTWTTLQDAGETDPPQPFDFASYLDTLQHYNHNFLRLWTWEQAKWSADTRSDFWFAPSPFQRTGPGQALDGKPRFDLTVFDEAYFRRLRDRVSLAAERGMYVAVMLFNGWSIEDKNLGMGNPWRGHPFNRENNINGIDGDSNRNGEGEEVHTLQLPAVLAMQEQYIRRVLDTLNPFDNVLYEVSNESPHLSQAWQYHMVHFIKEYEAKLPKQHPVGMTVEWPEGSNEELLAGPADWVSLNGSTKNPADADGTKVILDDTDHLCGVCGDLDWPWRSFLRGRNPIFMDLYDGSFTLDPPFDHTDRRWADIRRNLGYTLTFAQRVELRSMRPRGELASTGFCLAHAAATDAEYVVYTNRERSVDVDLSATPGRLAVEWLSPSAGELIRGDSIDGGAIRTLPSPAVGYTILYVTNREAR
jgi:Family of unknown function (DUF6298)